MSITAIARNFNGDPNLVTMVTDNSAAEVTTTGYFIDPAIVAQVELLNNGVFETAVTDLWLIYTTNGVAFYTYDSTTGSFVALTGNAGLSSTLSNGNIFVGNASNVATGVAPSGDITLSNTGVFGIAAGVIVNADISASAAIAFSKLAALNSGNILVGSAGNVATSVAMSGDITISNAGVTAIGAGKVLLAMLGTGIAPAGVVKFMGQVTTVGGAAAEAFTVTGALAASDRAFVQVVDNGTNNVTVLQAVVTNDTLTVTFSADPGNDAVINYQLLRAAS